MVMYEASRSLELDMVLRGGTIHVGDGVVLHESNLSPGL